MKPYTEEWFAAQKKQDPHNPDPQFIPFYAIKRCFSCGHDLLQYEYWYLKTGCPACNRSFVD